MVKFESEYGAVLFNEKESADYKKYMRGLIILLIILYSILFLPFIFLIVFKGPNIKTIENAFCPILIIIISVIYFTFCKYIIKDTGVVIFENGIGYYKKNLKFLPFQKIKVGFTGIQIKKKKKSSRDWLIVFLLTDNEQVEIIELQTQNDFNRTIKVLGNIIQLNEKPLLCKDKEMIEKVLTKENSLLEKQKNPWEKTKKPFFMIGAFFLLIFLIPLLSFLNELIGEFGNLSSDRLNSIIMGIILCSFFPVLCFIIGISYLNYRSYRHFIDTNNPKDKKALFDELTMDFRDITKSNTTGKDQKIESIQDILIQNPTSNEKLYIEYNYDPDEKEPYIDFKIGRIKSNNLKLAKEVQERIEQSERDEIKKMKDRLQIE